MIVLIITQVIGTIGVGVAPSIGILLASEVTDNEALAGLARTSSTLGAALLGVPLGNLAARRGRRIALSIGWWLAAVGAALLVASAQWSLVAPMFIGLLLIGSGSAVSLQSRFAATDLAEDNHRGRALALVMWVGALGSVLGPNLGIPGEIIGASTGLTVYAGAFLVAAICLAVAGFTVFALLRPDPLLRQQQRLAVSDRAAKSVQRSGSRIRLTLTEVRTNRRARYAMNAILTAQIVMVSVMTMTPVHLAHQGDSVTVIGLTISLHVAGMFALAPVVGILADRYGARPIIGIGIAIFLASLLVGAIFPHDTGWIIASLILLGFGWSFVNVAGSTLFNAAISPETRASSQGGIDALANLCGATAALIAGPLLAVTNFSVLSIIAIVVLVPLTVLTAARARPQP